MGNPRGAVRLDTEAIARLRQLPMVGQLDAAHQREHALEVHVPFLQHVLDDFRLVPIVAGDAPPDAVAALFDAVWGGPETLIVVSTDLSHYLDYAACRSLDARTAEAIERFDDLVIGSAEACGQVPTRGLLRVARRRGMAIERLDLRNSGDTAGPRDRVVGYGAWALYEAAGYEAAGAEDPERAAIEARPHPDRARARRHRGRPGHRSRRGGAEPAAAASCWPRRAPHSSRCAATAGCAAASAPRSPAGRWSLTSSITRSTRLPRSALSQAACAGTGGAGAVGVGADGARADALRQ